MRLDVNQFKPSRSQKRAALALATMQVALLPLQFKTAHFDLYERYQSARHGEDTPAQTPAHTRQAYEQFLLNSQINSHLLELRDARGALLAVSVVDWVANGASAVYTFYEPAARGSLGTSAVMWLIAEAKARGLPYVYLGYWIAASPKMAYKSNFQPAQLFQDGAWQAF
jgi:leucyl-tRNA---protein transferase